MNFEREIALDLPAEPGGGQDQGGQAEGGPIDDLARGEFGQNEQEGSHDHDLGEVREHGKRHGGHRI